MKNKLLYILIFSVLDCFSQSKTILNGELTYWKVQDIGVTIKTKMLLVFDEQSSCEQVTYIIPPNANDSAYIEGEKHQNIINEKGESVNKVGVMRGPTKAGSVSNGFTIYKSFKKNKIFDKKPFAKFGSNGENEYLIVEDEIIDFGWKITSERKKIGEFECTKAISKPFRGRVYEAWFAPEIPISNGPWKLGGLPGLILEAEDQSREIRFIFESIRVNQMEKVLIKNPFEDSKLRQVTWEEYRKMVKDKETQMHKFVIAKGGKINKFVKKKLKAQTNLFLTELLFRETNE